MNKIQYSENIEYFQYFKNDAYLLCLFNEASMKACAIWCENHPQELEYTNKNVYYINVRGDIIAYGAIGGVFRPWRDYCLPVLGIKIGDYYRTISDEWEACISWDENMELL